MAPERPTAEIRSLCLSDRDVAVIWADGQRSVFHHLWLRDNCACSACGPHDSGSRLQRLLDIPDTIAPASAVLDGKMLRIDWADDAHVSHYDAPWLRAHAYGPTALVASRRPCKTLWDASLADWPAVEWDDVLSDLADRQRLHASVAEYGFVVVRGLGTGHDAIEILAREVGYLRETHYGQFFDLITRDQPLILADLAGPLLPHTDESYRTVPTGINIFHCIQPSSDGGGLSQLVDGHHVAEHLRQRHPLAFTLLSTLPIRHERRVDGELIVSELPAIVLDHAGEVIEVRLNERTMTALCLPEDVMADAYTALRTAFHLAYDPHRRIDYQLQAGEALLFDNLRVLHGRSGYAGHRHLRQCQVMRDEFFARGAWLAENAPAPHSSDQPQATRRQTA